MQKIIFLLFSFFLVACGGGYNPDKAALHTSQQVGSLKYISLGEGKGLMPDSLSEIQGSANFEMSFSLQEGGSAIFYFFAKENLSDGLTIEFKKEQGQLKVLASAQGVQQEWSSLFSGIDTSGVMTFTLDIHNNESPAHIMLWSGSKNSSLNHRNTVYNSAEDSLDLNYDAAPGNGLGRSWGFQLNNAELTTFQKSAAQDAH